MKTTDAKSAGSPAAASWKAAQPRQAGQDRADLDRPAIGLQAQGGAPTAARACGGGVPRKCADVSAGAPGSRNAEIRRTGAGGAEHSKYAAPGRGDAIEAAAVAQFGRDACAAYRRLSFGGIEFVEDPDLPPDVIEWRIPRARP